MLVVAMLCLPGLDAIAKGLAGEVSAGQIAWTRLVLQGLFLLPFMIRGGGFQITHVWKHAARGFLIATATLLFFSAVMVMPLADAISIFDMTSCMGIKDEEYVFKVNVVFKVEN